jgi:hypothetical protein
MTHCEGIAGRGKVSLGAIKGSSLEREFNEHNEDALDVHLPIASTA